MAKSKMERFFTAEITRLYGVHSAGKSINIMDMSKVMAAGMSAIPQGLPAVEAAVVAAIARYCTPICHTCKQEMKTRKGGTVPLCHNPDCYIDSNPKPV